MVYGTVQALGNMLLAAVLVAGKTVQRLFLGSLRFREVERLHLRIREAVIETCLAMTVFRDDFNTHFILMFGLLLFLKVFHWLAKDRIEFVRFLSLGRRPCAVGLFLVHWGVHLGGGRPHSMVLCAVLSDWALQVGAGIGGRLRRWALTQLCHAGANRPTLLLCSLVALGLYVSCSWLCPHSWKSSRCLRARRTSACSC